MNRRRPVPSARPRRADANPVSMLAAVGLSLVLLVLVVIGGASAWLGVREWHRNIMLSNEQFDQVVVVQTWYKTPDLTYRWRGPVADVQYVTGDAVGKRIQAELMSDRPAVGDKVFVRRAPQDANIAQSRATPLLWWQDVVPFLVMAFAVFPMPALLSRIARARRRPRRRDRIIRIEGERVQTQPRQVA